MYTEEDRNVVLPLSCLIVPLWCCRAFSSKLGSLQGNSRGYHLLSSHVQPKVKEFCFSRNCPQVSTWQRFYIHICSYPVPNWAIQTRSVPAGAVSLHSPVYLSSSRLFKSWKSSPITSITALPTGLIEFGLQPIFLLSAAFFLILLSWLMKYYP